jgi:hypothetical protein
MRSDEGVNPGIGSDAEAIRGSLRDYLNGLVQNEPNYACPVISEEGRKSLISFTQTATDCPSAIAELSGYLGPEQQDLPRRKITVRQTGTTAIAEPRGTVAPVRMSKQQGFWLITEFLGP